MKEKTSNPKGNRFRSFQSYKSSKGIKEVLKVDNFRKLWIGQIFSQLADKFYIVFMVYLIAQYWIGDTPQDNEQLTGLANTFRIDFETRAQAITLLATGVYAVNTLPAILFGSFAGVSSDRWPKRRIMVLSNGLRGLLVLLVPMCLLPGPIWIGISWGYWAILAITFFESILTQFFAPAEQTSIPLLIPKENLLAANSLYQSTSMSATIIGFAIGEPILRIFKESFSAIGIKGGEFLLLPFCYGVSAIILSKIQLIESQKKECKKTYWREIIDGLRVLRNTHTVRGAILNLVLLYSLLAALYVLSIGLASKISQLGPTQFGTLLAMSGVGMASGALVIAQFGHRVNTKFLSSIGLGIISCSLILLGNAQGILGFTLVLCYALGGGSALVAIPAQTILQEDTPEENRGKVFGLQNNLINISLSIPLVITGTFISKYGLSPVLWFLAIIALIATIIEFPWERE